jgi:hypothetical protein
MGLHITRRNTLRYYAGCSLLVCERHPMKMAFVALLCACFVTSCAAPPPASFIPLGQGQEKAPVQEVIKNYRIGESRKASVGESIVTVKDYYVAKSGAFKALEASESFEVWSKDPTASRAMLLGTKGAAIPISAEAVIDGKNYYLIESTQNLAAGSLSHGIYIGEGGVPLMDRFRTTMKVGNIVNASDRALGVRINPPNVRFTNKMQEKSEVLFRGQENFEIVFTGKSRDELTFLYREFSSSDHARQAFFQNLTYSAKEPIIRFRKLKIKIEHVSNDGITYTVLED